MAVEGGLFLGERLGDWFETPTPGEAMARTIYETRKLALRWRKIYEGLPAAPEAMREMFNQQEQRLLQVAKDQEQALADYKDWVIAQSS